MEKRNKVLFVASIEKHLRHFHSPYMWHLQGLGYEVHTAARGENEIEEVQTHFDVSFCRSPLGMGNIGAYLKLKSIIKQNDYSMIHCHTPVASLLTRMAARKARKRGTVVVYTAHGFHFYEGNSALKNWIYSHVEKFASRYTDCIVTINHEDYTAVERYGFATKNVFESRGVGINGNRFKPVDEDTKRARREALGLGQDDFVLIYPAEYSFRKNQEVLLRAVAIVNQQQPGVVLLMPGMGRERDNLVKLAEELGIYDCIKIWDARSDIDVLMTVSDLSAAPSRQEGLPTHVLEAMATGLPCVASRIRGHVDLVEDGVNGFLYDIDNPEEMAECILRLKKDREMRQTMGENSRQKSEKYMLERTVAEMAVIYGKLLGNKES